VIIDITRPISAALPVWPGDPRVEIEPVARLEAGDPAAVSRLTLGTHTGTHVDPPAHFLPGGATVDEIALDVLVGPAVVVDFAGSGGGGTERLRAAAGHHRRVLLKTGATDGVVTPDVARHLVDGGVFLVGVDTSSIEPGETEYPVHRLLLSAGVVIVEGLELSHVAPGEYQLVCLPLRIAGGDGAPARAVLVTP